MQKQILETTMKRKTIRRREKIISLEMGDTN